MNKILEFLKLFFYKYFNLAFLILKKKNKCFINIK